MSENTGIAWTDHTFNCWWGCQKVSPGCDHCYAETLDARFGKPTFGPGVPRRRTSQSNWHQPVKWNREAEKAGIRRKVFCASMADVFDNAVPPEWRHDLWALFRKTPWLDWQILTKRPQNFAGMLPGDWGYGWPNVWLGVSAENQTEADRRIPLLIETPARLRFISAEPLLGPINLRQWINDWGCGCGYGGDGTLDHCPNCGWVGEGPTIEFDDGDAPGDCPECNEPMSDYFACPECKGTGQDGSGFGPNSSFIDWIIVGGESGPGFRSMKIEWAESITSQCKSAGAKVFFKQDSALKSGQRGRASDALWSLKEFP